MKSHQYGLFVTFIIGLLLAMLPQSSYYGFAIFMVAIFAGLFLVLGDVKRRDVWKRRAVQI